MQTKETVFLETHNLNNRATGLGTFNYELIKGFSQISLENFELHLNASDVKGLASEFGNTFKYHKYFGFHRYPFFQTKKKYSLWHSVNQNTKIEPKNPQNYLLTIHDVNFFEEISSDINHPRNQQFIEKLNRATAISYISEFAKKQTYEYFNVPNVPEYIVHNGNPISTLQDTSGFRSEIPLNKPFFYSLGDFLKRKNFMSIIKMMEQIDDHILIISGNNEKKYGLEIKQYIKEKNLENKIFLTGRVSDVAKQFYLKNCTAFLFPSIREGFGLPPIEAMRFGKPVFLSDLTSLPEIGGDVANYWTNFDPEYMKQTLFDGLHQNELNKEIHSQQLIERGLSFDWKNTAAAYLEIYKKSI